MERESVPIKDTSLCLNDNSELTGDTEWICPFLSKGKCYLGLSSRYPTGPTRAQFRKSLRDIPTTCPLEWEQKLYFDNLLIDLLEPFELEPHFEEIFIPIA